MKYLKNINQYQYKNSDPINEVFQNNVTWGGSLLGRLVNSTIRRLNIYRKTYASGLSRNIEEIRSILSTLATETGDTDVNMIIIMGLLEEMRNRVNDGSEISYFLGEGTEEDPGLINATIKKIEDIETFEDKDKVIQKLVNFRRDLEKIDVDDEDDVQEVQDEVQDDSNDSAKYHKYLKKNLIKLLGKNKVSLTVKWDDTPYDKLLKGDLSFLKDGKYDVDQLISNIRNMLLYPEYLEYLKDNEEEVYKIVKKLVGNQREEKPIQNKVDIQDAPDQESNKNDEPMEDKSDNNSDYVSVSPEEHMYPSRFNDNYNYINEGSVQDSILATLNANIKPIVGSIRNWYKSISDPLAQSQNIKHMISLMNKNISLKNTVKRIEFELHDTDTLEMVAYAWSQMNDAVYAKFNRENKDHDLNKENVFSEIMRDKIYLNGDNIVLKTDQERKAFDGKVDAIMNLNDVKMYENYDLFDRIYEASKPISAVQEAWTANFTKEDEEKYCLNEKQAIEAAKKYAKAKTNYDLKNNPDPIIRIANLFGDAYKKYTTEVIPSGRPEEKISNATRREYKYVGKGSAPSNNGYGPWIIKRPYDKWRKGIEKLLEDPNIRQTLTNKNFTINGKQGAGILLLKFINAMLNINMEDFDKNRWELINRYFDINANSEGTISNVNYEMRSGKDDTIKPIKGDLKWKNVNEIKKSDFEFKKFNHAFIYLKGKDSSDKDVDLVLYIMSLSGGKIYFKMQSKSDNMPKLYGKAMGLTLPSTTNLSTETDDVYFGEINLNNNTVKTTKTIKMSYVDINDTTKLEKDKELKISGIYILNKGESTYKMTIPSDSKFIPDGDKPILSDDYKKYF